MTSKYQPLADYLIAHTDVSAIVLTFGAIEAIIGVPLPKTMQVDSSAWNSAHHAYVRDWGAAGWVATLDGRNRQVVFAREERAALPGKMKGRTRPSRFQALAAYLAQCTEPAVVLDFPQIEAIIGHPLAVSAYTSNAMWTVATLASVRCWQAVGWRARLDIKGRCVVFTHDAEGGRR